MKKCNYKLKKAQYGLAEVSVPQRGDGMNILSSGANMASTGGQIAGPWGAAAGAVIGLGLGWKEAAAQDKANDKAVAYNKNVVMNQQYTGVDPTSRQAAQRYGKGVKSLQALPAKPIEVEGGEIAMDEDLNMVADFKGGPKHDAGGIPYLAREGETIFPANKRKLVLDALGKKDKYKLNKLKNTLPKDK